MKIDLERFAQAVDLKAEILKAMTSVLADPKFKVTRNLVLVAGYIAPAVTKGGIIRPMSSINEDRWQSKVGFVLAKGPIAFKFPEGAEHVVEPEIGDWVVYRTSDTYEVGFGDGVVVRYIIDELIYSITGDPSKVY